LIPAISDRLQADRPPRSAQAPRGFTLIELALVLLVVAVVAALALPRLEALTRARIDAAAERTRAVLSYLAEEASLRGRIYRLRIDDDGGGWTVESLAPWAIGETPDFTREWDPVVRDTRLEEGVFVRELRIGGRPAPGLAMQVYFAPDGIAEDVEVVLENDSERRSVLLSAATSSASVSDPYALAPSPAPRGTAP
jgi:prepilin-type N-terminal cleavage/methylation domain-containing protein